MDVETIEQIVSLVSQYPVSEISVERDGLKIVARKPLSAVRGASVSAPEEETSSTEDASTASALELEAEALQPVEPQLLTAGLVGLFRHSEPPVGYGAVVSMGQVVGSIEAMKVLNDVRAASGGQVVDVLVEDGAPVEYGQALFRIMAA